MALIDHTLPFCDVCLEPWFPDAANRYKGISARQDPRGYDARRRADGLPGLRCGKCKSFGWDRKYTGDRRKKEPHGQEAATPARKKTAPKRCIHRLLHCAQCQAGVKR